MTSLDEYIKRLEQKIEIRVGFPKDKQVIYPPDDRKGHHNKGGQTVAQVATWNNYGTKRGIPPRPFMNETLRINKSRIEELVKNYFSPKNIFDDAYLHKVGIFIRDKIMEKITVGPWKENSKETIRKKKSDRPLIDRGIMRRSVSYEIVKK